MNGVLITKGTLKRQIITYHKIIEKLKKKEKKKKK